MNTSVTVEQNIVHIVTAGVPGPPGPPGTGVGYVHEQLVASDNWSVVHNLGKYPCVIITDDANLSIDGVIEYIDADILNIYFNNTITGKAVLN